MRRTIYSMVLVLAAIVKAQDSRKEDCWSGTYWTGSKCAQCEANTYSFGGEDYCYDCPPGTVSPPGSIYDSDCMPEMCEAGKYLSDYDGCLECGENTYSFFGDNVCTDCPYGKISAPGSMDEYYCTSDCPAGTFWGEYDGCPQCKANTYSYYGSESCTPCPAGKISSPGSTDEMDCTYAPCSAGDFMTQYSGCQQCGANTYSGAGAETCTPCPDNKISAAGSTSEAHCKYAPCSAGHYMTESGCQQCEANTYSGAGAETCTPCPDNKISAAGSSSEAHCEQGPAKTESEDDCESNYSCFSSANSLVAAGGAVVASSILIQLF